MLPELVCGSLVVVEEENISTDADFLLQVLPGMIQGGFEDLICFLELCWNCIRISQSYTLVY